VAFKTFKINHLGFTSFLSVLVVALLIGGIFIGVKLTSQSQNLQSSAKNQVRKKGKTTSGEILVKFKEGRDESKKEKIRQKIQGRLESKIDKLKVEKIKVDDAGKDSIVTSLSEDPDVEFVEPNFIAEEEMTPNDPIFTKQWNLKKIGAVEAWDMSIGSNIKIAVLDTGVDKNHPDLAGKVFSGYDFINGDSDPSDDKYHGTAVAGVIAALTNNSLEVAGLASGSTILPVKVLDSNGSGPYDVIAKGIIYATENGAKVINLSLGGPSYSATLENAVNYAFSNGVVVVAAAGNQSGPVNYPAAFKNVVAVSATDQNDAKASFSNFGAEIDISAPGVLIYTTNSAPNTYGNGTSFASPHVAAAAAMIFSSGASSNQAVMDALYKGADDLGTSGIDQEFGVGRLNIYNSLLKINVATQNSPSPSSTISPISSPTQIPTSAPTIQPVSLSTPDPSQTAAPKDTTPPQLTITSPLNNSSIQRRSYLSVAASAFDSSGISKVEFRRNGSLMCTDTLAAYTCRLYTTASKTRLTIEVKAYDFAGNISNSSISVTTY
jgi:thermitase